MEENNQESSTQEKPTETEVKVVDDVAADSSSEDDVPATQEASVLVPVSVPETSESEDDKTQADEPTEATGLDEKEESQPDTDTTSDDESKTDIETEEPAMPVTKEPEIQEESEPESDTTSDSEPKTDIKIEEPAIPVTEEPANQEESIDPPKDDEAKPLQNNENPVSDEPSVTKPIETNSTVVGVAASEMGKSPHRNNKKLAVVVTLVVATLLSAVAVYVYLSTKGNTEETTDIKENTATSQQAELPKQEDLVSTPATAEDIDQASKDINDAINSLDETSDFSEESISDTTLGL